MDQRLFQKKEEKKTSMKPKWRWPRKQKKNKKHFSNQNNIDIFCNVCKCVKVQDYCSFAFAGISPVRTSVADWGCHVSHWVDILEQEQCGLKLTMFPTATHEDMKGSEADTVLRCTMSNTLFVLRTSGLNVSFDKCDVPFSSLQRLQQTAVKKPLHDLFIFRRLYINCYILDISCSS